MSRDDDALAKGNAYYAPSAFERIRAKRAELEAEIAAGTITREAAGAALFEFKSLQIAHVREHGSETKADP